jgi:hypothetical protein
VRIAEDIAARLTHAQLDVNLALFTARSEDDRRVSKHMRDVAHDTVLELLELKARRARAVSIPLEGSVS